MPLALIPNFHMPDIGISEILDIFIVSLLIYRIMKWIRQTHAWALLKGIVMVVFVAFLAFVFDLVTVMWVIENALAMGLIALVILFQPELRKALEQLGRGVDLHGLPKFGAEQKAAAAALHSADEIVQGVLAMSASRTGALICIEREVSLNDSAESGIPLDAIVSRQLLMNIFEDKTPLHDGAVIIRGNRIKAAACILPLTSEDIGHELGTRHRAAIGISETSDALVIVVSEETGSISAASKGKLHRYLSEKSLKKFLSADKSEETKRRLIPWKNRKNLS